MRFIWNGFCRLIGVRMWYWSLIHTLVDKINFFGDKPSQRFSNPYRKSKDTDPNYNKLWLVIKWSLATENGIVKKLQIICVT